jgi:predicted Fe-Mo cluster-binding NifX family protein
MKVCVAAQGTEVTSHVSSRFGRAPCLLVVYTETGGTEVLGGTGASHGAGVQAAQLAVRALPAAVVTGEIGPKALEVLVAAGIPVHRAEGMTVAEAVEELERGGLQPIRAPTRRGPPR